MTKRPTRGVALPDGRLPNRQHLDSGDPAALGARIQELETLCAEVYVAAVELGLPQPLLNRLWTVAAHGRTPHAYHVDLPPRIVIPTPAAAPAMEIPDIRLTDRPASRDALRAKAPQPELKALPERRRVMVVDDDPTILDVLERILQRENYELIFASSGPEALQRAAEQPAFDLLITDYVMPVMTGRELAEKMRGRWPGIKVLYQTGFSDMLFEHHVELDDGSAFLEKPFTARGLREAARLMLFGMINPS